MSRLGKFMGAVVIGIGLQGGVACSDGGSGSDHSASPQLSVPLTSCGRQALSQASGPLPRFLHCSRKAGVLHREQPPSVARDFG